MSIYPGPGTPTKGDFDIEHFVKRRNEIEQDGCAIPLETESETRNETEGIDNE